MDSHSCRGVQRAAARAYVASLKSCCWMGAQAVQAPCGKPSMFREDQQRSTLEDRGQAVNNSQFHNCNCMLSHALFAVLEEGCCRRPAMQAMSAVPAVPGNATIPCNVTKKRTIESSSGANCVKKAKQQHAAVPSTCTAQQMAQMAASMGAMAASMGAMQLPMMPPMGMMGMMPPMPGMLPGMFFPPAMGMGMPFCPPFCSPFSFTAMAGAMAAATSAPAPSAVDPAASTGPTQSTTTTVPPAVDSLGPFCGFAPMAVPQPQQAASVMAARTASGVSSQLFPSASCSNSFPAPPAELLPPRADSPGSVCNDRAERVEDDEFANFIDSFLKNDDAELAGTLFQSSASSDSNGAGEEGGLARSDSLLNLLGTDLDQLSGF